MSRHSIAEASAPPESSRRAEGNSAAVNSSTGGRWRRIAESSWWPWAKRIFGLGLFLLIAALVIKEAKTIVWSQVYALMRETPLSMLLTAAALAAASHALYATYDLFGRAYTGHRLRWPTVYIVNLVSYAFTLNLGTLLGGVAIRYRLYMQRGLTLGVVTQVVSLSLFTTLLGYLLLAGIMMILQPLELPKSWHLGSSVLRIAGVTAVLIAIGYVAFCAYSRGRSFRLRGKELVAPSVRIAALQLVVSSINWLLMAGVIYLLLQQQVSFAAVLFALLAAAIAGVVTHIPAGLGVLEAVFVAVLSSLMPKEQLLAGLLLYRLLYYVLPLALAVMVYVVLETRAKKTAVVE